MGGWDHNIIKHRCLHICIYLYVAIHVQIRMHKLEHFVIACDLIGSYVMHCLASMLHSCAILAQAFVITEFCHEILSQVRQPLGQHAATTDTQVAAAEAAMGSKGRGGP